MQTGKDPCKQRHDSSPISHDSQLLRVVLDCGSPQPLPDDYRVIDRVLITQADQLSPKYPLLNGPCPTNLISCVAIYLNESLEFTIASF